MDLPLHFSMEQAGSKKEGEGTGRIDAEAISILSKDGPTFRFSLRDIVLIDVGDHQVALQLSNGAVRLNALGYRFEDCCRELHSRRNEIILHDLLMNERLRKPGVKGILRIVDPKGNATSWAEAELRVYETALVILPTRSEMTRILLGDIVSAELKDFILFISLEDGDRLEIAKLGREFEPLRKSIVDGKNELDAAVQELVKSASPLESSEVVWKAARLMREGRSAKRKDIDSLSTTLWKGLEDKLTSLGMKDEYQSLLQRSFPDLVRIGMKRGLVGDKADYTWVLFPLKDANLIALEASAEGSGRATYFFRTAMNGEDAPRNALAERSMDLLDHNLSKINFRREPIYLPEERLLEPKYSQYRFSILRMPELRDLRQRFLGRVAHFSSDQWTADVADIIDFSHNSAPGERWKKGEEDASKDF